MGSSRSTKLADYINAASFRLLADQIGCYSLSGHREPPVLTLQCPTTTRVGSSNTTVVHPDGVVSATSNGAGVAAASAALTGARPPSTASPSHLTHSPVVSQNSLHDKSVVSNAGNDYSPSIFTESYSFFGSSNIAASPQNPSGSNVSFHDFPNVMSSAAANPFLAAVPTQFSSNTSFPLPYTVDYGATSECLESSATTTLTQTFNPQTTRENADNEITSRKEARPRQPPALLASAQLGEHRLASHASAESLPSNSENYCSSINFAGTFPQPEMHFLVDSAAMFCGSMPMPMATNSSLGMLAHTQTSWNPDMATGYDTNFASFAVTDGFQAAALNAEQSINEFDWESRNCTFGNSPSVAPLASSLSQSQPSYESQVPAPSQPNLVLPPTTMAERPIAPKPAPPGSSKYAASNGDTSMRRNGGQSIDQNPSNSANTATSEVEMDIAMQPPRIEAPSYDSAVSMDLSPSTVEPSAAEPLVLKSPPTIARALARSDMRRLASIKERLQEKVAPVQERMKATGSKPRTNGGLSRSLSDSCSKKPKAMTKALPKLAPMPTSKPTSSLSASPASGVPPQTMPCQPQWPGRRLSPRRSLSHRRLPSLISIPELDGPHQRMQAAFSIDENGRARVYTVVVGDNGERQEIPSPTSGKQSSPVQQPLPRQSSVGHDNDNDGGDDEDDGDENEDDEPIIIHSRKCTVVLPDPRKPTRTNPLLDHRASQHSLSDSSSSSHSVLLSDDILASDEESVVEVVVPTRATSLGDAAIELFRLREKTKFKAAPPTNNSFGRRESLPQPNFHTKTYSLVLSSPLTSGSHELSARRLSPLRRSRVRCVCHRSGFAIEDGYGIQCKSCEMWLHASCITTTQRSLPSAYICPFCTGSPPTNASAPRTSNQDTNRNRGRALSTLSLPGLSRPLSLGIPPLVRKPLRKSR